MINIRIRNSNKHLCSVLSFLWAFCPKLQPPYLCAKKCIKPMAVTGTGMVYSWHPSKVRCRYSDGFSKLLGAETVWGKKITVKRWNKNVWGHLFGGCQTRTEWLYYGLPSAYTIFHLVDIESRCLCLDPSMEINMKPNTVGWPLLIFLS